ncbi:hypothetical protein ACFWBB_09905 [Streptomyces sp. NPDC060000]|uniref:hypothetical protein n=1 Tax=Streptomyces sp. NPDC060000 TaxID=3347031 RepID=UPI003683F073
MTELGTIAKRNPQSATLDLRILYLKAVNPEGAPPPVVPVPEFLNGPDDYQAAAADWACAERARYRDLAARATGEDDRKALVRRTALAAAPLGLIAGAWLQWLSELLNEPDRPAPDEAHR